jgi:hypothetical protein
MALEERRKILGFFLLSSTALGVSGNAVFVPNGCFGVNFP